MNRILPQKHAFSHAKHIIKTTRTARSQRKARTNATSDSRSDRAGAELSIACDQNAARLRAQIPRQASVSHIFSLSCTTAISDSELRDPPPVGAGPGEGAGQRRAALGSVHSQRTTAPHAITHPSPVPLSRGLSVQVLIAVCAGAGAACQHRVTKSGVARG